MRYDLGLMDMYPIEVCGTCVENNPMYKVTFRDSVDPLKLEDALYRAIRLHPLFGTRVRYDRGYYLETNNRPIKIIHAEETDRPLYFGTNTNEFPWQVCWNDCSITLEWCHGVTDGQGALDFLKTVLSMYCGMRNPVIPRKIMLGPGLEPFVDAKEKGIGFSKQPAGFSVKDLPVYHRGFQTDCHILEARTEEILNVSRQCQSSVSSVISILLSRAIRKHISETARNRNVACNIVMNLRKPLQYETMHNCVEYKRITYVDRYDKMEFSEVARIYKSELDNARRKENIVKIITDRVRTFRLLHLMGSKELVHLAFDLTGRALKHTDCNCVLTYVGKTDFPEEVNEQIEDVQFRVWHDFGECILAAIDYNGIFKINLCENYIEKGIVEDFIRISKEYGIQWDYKEKMLFEQRRFIEEDNARSGKKKEEKTKVPEVKAVYVPYIEKRVNKNALI